MIADFFTKWKKRKLFLVIAIMLFTLLLFEFKNLYIDFYNFKQARIIQTVLESNSKLNYDIRNLVDFNEKFIQNISPIKNCYFVSNLGNWKYQYLVWFQFESWTYRLLFASKYYAYPKYDMPYDNMCAWWPCYDQNRYYFTNTISTVCKPTISWYVFRDTNANLKKDEWEKWFSWAWVWLDGWRIYTDETWFYSFSVRKTDWGHSLRIWAWKKWHEHRITYPYSKKYPRVEWYDDVIVNDDIWMKDLHFIVK